MPGLYRSLRLVASLVARTSGPWPDRAPDAAWLAYVKPYVKQHKNDATDAEAIFAAVSRPNMRFVATKTPGQQSCLTDARKQIKGRTVPQSPFAENNGARAKKLAVLPIYHDRSARELRRVFPLAATLFTREIWLWPGAEDEVRSASLKRQRARSAHPRKAWPRVCSLHSGVAAIAFLLIADIDAPRARNRARVKGGAEGARTLCSCRSCCPATQGTRLSIAPGR